MDGADVNGRRADYAYDHRAGARPRPPTASLPYLVGGQPRTLVSVMAHANASGSPEKHAHSAYRLAAHRSNPAISRKSAFK
jgi:hypothetical protein